jgi:hypothetical protein
MTSWQRNKNPCENEPLAVAGKALYGSNDLVGTGLQKKAPGLIPGEPGMAEFVIFNCSKSLPDPGIPGLQGEMEWVPNTKTA